MARPFMFAALCQRAHPLKHSLAESTFVSRVRKTANKSSLAEKIVTGSLVSRGISYTSIKIFVYFSQYSVGKLTNNDPYTEELQLFRINWYGEPENPDN